MLLKIDIETIYSDKELYPDEFLVEEIRNKDNQEAYMEIYKRYQYMIEAKSRKYWTNDGDSNDMQQEGCIGMMNAVRDYNPEKGIPFKNFADLCITRQMITAIKSSTRQKHLPLNKSISLDKPFMVTDSSEKILLNIIEDVSVENPETTIVSNESSALITSHLIETLSNLEKGVYRGLLENKKYQEIGIDVDRDVKSVDNAVQRIRKKLAIVIKNLKEDDFI